MEEQYQKWLCRDGGVRSRDQRGIMSWVNWRSFVRRAVLSRSIGWIT
eukprot:gene32444-42031_t